MKRRILRTRERAALMKMIMRLRKERRKADKLAFPVNRRAVDVRMEARVYRIDGVLAGLVEAYRGGRDE